jgi:hypothetical protein
MGHATGIYDERICLIAGDNTMPCMRNVPGHGLGFRLVQFATEGVEGNRAFIFNIHCGII